MHKVHEDGFFELVVEEKSLLFKYSFISSYEDGSRNWVDPYSFLPFISNESLQGFNQGWDRRPFDKLGAIPAKHQGHEGVSFVVWAPSAKSVHLVGDFNHWNLDHFRCEVWAVLDAVKFSFLGRNPEIFISFGS